MEVQTIPGGTKDKPQSVPSMYPERIVGCICKLIIIVNFVNFIIILLLMKNR